MMLSIASRAFSDSERALSRSSRRLASMRLVGAKAH